MLLRWLAKRAQTLPAPISVPATQSFDGNDGPWSSFPIQIGTPPQTVKVLPSTKGSQTWAVLPQGCTPSDPVNCTLARGGVYQPNSSSTWSQNQGASGGLFPLLLETNLDQNGTGLYGYDTVVLGGQGSNGPSLTQQVVAGIATKAFDLGIFGLSPNAVTLPQTNNLLPDYMLALNKSNLIPSLSWSYTAGNQYRPGPSYGSLILGGQDISRFEPNDITFPFNDTDPNLPDLTVNIGAIFLTLNGESTTLQSDNETIQASIDSTTPYIWLPQNVCEQFEGAFGIVWDTAVQGYLVNDTLHRNLSSSGTSVVFNLGNASTTPGQGFNISLPYAAFDLTAGPPLLKNSSRYFPLMRAANQSQITLGRTFLQEAYLTADYERKNFSLSQCTWQSPEIQPHIIPITRLGTSTLPGSSSSSSSSSSTTLSGGAIAGIVIGVLAALTLLILAAIILLRRYRRTHPPSSSSKNPPHPQNRPTHITLPPNIAEIDSANKDPYFYSPPKADQPHSPELDAVVHKGHELDSGVLGSPTTTTTDAAGSPTVEMASEADDKPVELDASEQAQRRSRILRSISDVSGGSGAEGGVGRRGSRLKREGSEKGDPGAEGTRPGQRRQESEGTEAGVLSPLSPVSGGGGGGGTEGDEKGEGTSEK